VTVLRYSDGRSEATDLKLPQTSNRKAKPLFKVNFVFLSILT